MKAITVSQDWGDKIMDGRKTIEVREYDTDYRGRLLITTWPHPHKERAGVALGTVELYDTRVFRNLTEGQKLMSGIPYRKWKLYNNHYAWFLKDPRPSYNFKVNGERGLWDFEFKAERWVRYANICIYTAAAIATAAILFFIFG